MDGVLFWVDGSSGKKFWVGGDEWRWVHCLILRRELVSHLGLHEDYHEVDKWRFLIHNSAQYEVS